MCQKNTPKTRGERPVRISVTLTQTQHAALKQLARLNNRSTTKQASTILCEGLGL